jgi:hypothetical protein
MERILTRRHRERWRASVQYSAVLRFNTDSTYNQARDGARITAANASQRRSHALQLSTRGDPQRQRARQLVAGHVERGKACRGGQVWQRSRQLVECETQPLQRRQRRQRRWDSAAQSTVTSTAFHAHIHLLSRVCTLNDTHNDADTHFWYAMRTVRFVSGDGSGSDPLNRFAPTSR